MILHEEEHMQRPALFPEHCTRADDLWFYDGNLTLKAENTLFRIYGGFLAARSSVFRDMLEFPPPEDGNETLDGSHIVTVYDSAKDLSYFLKAIFDSSFFMPPPTPTDLPIVEGVLRLALKYDVQYLKRRALSHLISTFPMSLSAWKNREKTRTIPPVDNTPFAAFRIAREFDLDFMLPSILYCISSHPFEKTLDSAVFQDDKISFVWPDKRMCIVGRQKLLMMQSQSALNMTRNAEAPVAECTGSSCASTRLRCADILSAWDMAGFLDYFEDNANVYSHEFCTVCRTNFKEMCALASQQMWSELPTMFGLPRWDELEKSRLFAFD
ncbi:hypothetical protein CPB83DRAFT_842433 [Crepidotus variabilis]|uniref:BTB domain-containing protein n=1 Tax=Crepidotus variabilis TaxID=179855 RepID=A0A9P6EVH4_9AGAR|nr:hypothetical protein CPB83DRAFT_842433 [Crepidotus variabilis]